MVEMGTKQKDIIGTRNWKGCLADAVVGFFRGSNIILVSMIMIKYDDHIVL
jgi:hypothetical protein